MPPFVALAFTEPLSAWLVRTSWQALVLVAIVATVQVLLGRLLEPRWRYALWMLVVVRLLMPVVPGSAWSVFNTPIPRIPLAASRMDTLGPATPQAADGVTVTVVKTFDLGGDPGADASGKIAIAPESFDWRNALLAVWLAGAVLLVLRFVGAHALLVRRLRGARPVDEELTALLDDCRRAMRVRANVRLIPTDAVGGPALFGFVRPKLLVPPGMLRELGRDELRFVFLHELAHLKRRDTWWNVPLSLAAALHWFNPAVWFALSRCRTERELACDAMVLDVADSPRAQQGYGQTMLRLAEALCAPQRRQRTAVPAALGILQTRSQLNRRITMISAFRRSSSSRRWSVLPAVLLVTVASCALTDKASSEGPAKSAAPTGEPVATFKAEPAHETAAAVEAVGVSAETARINQALDRRVPEMNFDAKPFKDVIEELRSTSGLDLVVNWRALEAAGIDREAPVSARLRNAKFAKVLRTVLDDVGGGTVELEYTIDEGALSITTEEDLNRNTITKVYDIRDLITDIPDYAPPGEARAELKPAPATQPGESLAKQIALLIQETVQPEAWRDAGGTVGSIRELAGQFVITATPQMHTQVEALLNQLRETRGVQISVEARFIALDPAALDKALGERLKNTLGKSGAATVWQLSDADVQAVLKTSQASAQTTLVTAPRVTLFNGQRAFVNVATQTAYVSGFTIFKKDGGETRYEPKISIVDSGILLDVRATASADRRQAVLTLKPKLSRLEGLRPEPYMGMKDLHVQVPEVVVHELQTTLSIPDRGTALIGGFAQSLNGGAANVGELVGQPNPVETEQNRSRIDLNKMPPSQNVFLLVKPTLIITEPQAR